MKAVRISPALVVHDIIVAIRNRPNQTLASKPVISNHISELPLLSWLCKPAVAVCTKRKNCRWQVRGRMNVMETGTVMQDLLVSGGKLGDIGTADALQRHDGQKTMDEAFHTLIGPTMSWPRTSSAPRAAKLEYAASRAPRHSVQHFIGFVPVIGPSPNR